MADSFRVALLDGLTPSTRRWLEQMSPGAMRATRRGAARGRLALRQSYDRFLRRRTGRGRRGIKYRVTKTATGIVATLWPSVGYVAAHELGSAVPAATIRPTRGRVLRFAVQGEVRFARFVRRPGFTLPRRPWLSAAVPAVEREMLAALEEEFAKVFEIPGFTRGTA